MTMGKDEAGADLAAIDDVVRQVKQSRIYRVSGDIAIMWGVLQFVQFGAGWISPKAVAEGWFVIDAIGVALTLALLRRARVGKSAGLGKAAAAFALFYAFGFCWSTLIGHFGAREASAFWHTLFLFGYCLAGLWFGVGFLVIGLALSAGIFAAYVLWTGPEFWAAVALIAGCGYIACGLWMRRA